MKILVAYRGTNVGQDLMDIAVKHAKAFDGRILVMTSLIGGEATDQETIDQAKENLEGARSFFEENGVDCEIHLLIRGMEAGEDIVSFAREKQADEIILGVKSRSKVGKLIFGSTAQVVILSAPCPVVSVR